jgi:spoIIIJ-associated protein
MSEPGEPEASSPESVEATGETVGEAKWSALRQLEQHYPGLDKGDVQFQVLSEGERGLLGVGQVPARVIAQVRPGGPRKTAPSRPAEEPGTPPALLREFLELVCSSLAVRASIAIHEDRDELVARLSGPDVGLLIGKRGHTIDSIQHLANALGRAAGEQRVVVVDAAGYRARRRASLERVAEDAARDALATGAPVKLEPMSAPERKIVHLALQERRDVTTGSEGAEPNRCVVVAPAPPA